MRQVIEFFVLSLTFTACYHYPLWTNDNKFWENFALSTAAACIFYFATTTVPVSISRIENRIKFTALLVDIIECCIAYDKFFYITDEQLFVGYGRGYAPFFSKVRVDETRPYKLVGHISLVRRGTPHHMSIDFAHTILSIIKDMRRLDAPFTKRYQKHLHEIAKLIDRFIARNGTPQNNNAYLQRLRGPVWRQIDKIIAETNDTKPYKNIIFTYFFKRELHSRHLRIKGHNEVNFAPLNT